MNRFEAEVRTKGMTVFAHIDHAAGAAGAGLSLRPTELLIFGDARGGTPLMEANQTIGIDLPLKVLVWQDDSGSRGSPTTIRVGSPSSTAWGRRQRRHPNHDCAAECAGDGGDHMSLVEGLDLASLP